MSADLEARDDAPTAEVQDDGTVDAKVKKRIIDARKRVDDREDYLYIQAPVENGLTVTNLTQDIYWGMVVKQFLRTIEPLLASNELSLSKDYYEGVDLGEVKLIPRDTEKYPFSEYAEGRMAEKPFKMRHNIPESVSLPEAATRPFEGLKSVIETNGVLSEQWTVYTNTWSDPDAEGVVRTADERPVPKDIYENAVRHADMFLQEAGVGLEIELSSYTGGEEPGL